MHLVTEKRLVITRLGAGCLGAAPYPSSSFMRLARAEAAGSKKHRRGTLRLAPVQTAGRLRGEPRIVHAAEHSAIGLSFQHPYSMRAYLHAVF